MQNSGPTVIVGRCILMEKKNLTNMERPRGFRCLPSFCFQVVERIHGKRRLANVVIIIVLVIIQAALSVLEGGAEKGGGGAKRGLVC